MEPSGSPVAYSALVTHPFDPDQIPLALLTPVTAAMRISDAARDTLDAGQQAERYFARWVNDPARRQQFFTAFDGQRTTLAPPERARRLAQLADEIAVKRGPKSEGFVAPTFVPAKESGTDADIATELPKGCLGALLAVRHGPSLVLLSAALGLTEMANLAVHLHAAAIAHHAAYQGLLVDPAEVGGKLALAVGARPVDAVWSFVQVKLYSVPTYAIGLQPNAPIGG